MGLFISSNLNLNDFNLEKRKDKRFIFKRKAFLIENNKTIQVMLYDVSAGGVSVVSDINYGYNQHLLLEMPFPDRSGDSEIVNIVSKSSVYSKDCFGFRVGFKFFNNSKRLSDAINKALINN